MAAWTEPRSKVPKSLTFATVYYAGWENLNYSKSQRVSCFAFIFSLWKFDRYVFVKQKILKQKVPI